VLAAVSKEWKGRGGKYLENRQVATSEPTSSGVVGVKDYDYNDYR
jgi:hypothetical protein